MADIEMDDYEINMKKIHCSMEWEYNLLSGYFSNESLSNPFSFNAQLININVNKIFTAFNNFGLNLQQIKILKVLLQPILHCMVV